MKKIALILLVLVISLFLASRVQFPFHSMVNFGDCVGGLKRVDGELVADPGSLRCYDNYQLQPPILAINALFWLILTFIALKIVTKLKESRG